MHNKRKEENTLILRRGWDGMWGLSPPPALLGARSYGVNFHFLTGLCPPWVCPALAVSAKGIRKVVMESRVCKGGIQVKTISCIFRNPQMKNDWKDHNQKKKKEKKNPNPHQVFFFFRLNMQTLGRSAEPFLFPAFLIPEPCHEHSASLLPPARILPNAFPCQGLWGQWMGLLHLWVMVSTAKHRLAMESLQWEIQHHLPATEKSPYANT